MYMTLSSYTAFTFFVTLRSILEILSRTPETFLQCLTANAWTESKAGNINGYKKQGVPDILDVLTSILQDCGGTDVHRNFLKLCITKLDIRIF